MSTQTKENKMGTMPIPKLLLQMSLPIMVSMLVQAFYNIVDSIFVSRISEDALTAVSLVFPVQNLMIAIASGTGVGINALLSRSLGEKNFENANKAAKNGIFLAVLSGIVFAAGGLGLMNLYFSSQTNGLVGNAEQIVAYGKQYMIIICACSIFVFTQITFERLLQATGLTIYTMISQGSGAIINIILDPIFIFGLLGMPKLGVAGAALATVIGQFAGACIGIFFNVRRNKEININMRRFRPDLTTIKNIYIVGIPSIIVQAIGSVMTFGMNKILVQFTATAATVFGVYFKLNSFIFMPVFGLNNGLVPIVAYNYGARNKKRIMSAFKLAVCIAVGVMLVGTVLFWIFPGQLLGIFEASPQMLEIGIPALRIISLSFTFAGYCIVCGSMFQALGNGMYSLINSFCRQLLVLLPTAWILSRISGLSAVWWSYPIAEIVSLLLSTYLLVRIYRLKIKNL